MPAFLACLKASKNEMQAAINSPITSIESGTFQGLSSLHTLDLGNNHLTMLNLTGATLASLRPCDFERYGFCLRDSWRVPNSEVTELVVDHALLGVSSFDATIDNAYSLSSGEIGVTPELLPLTLDAPLRTTSALDNVADVDDLITGLAIVGASSANGVWWYSINGGGEWNWKLLPGSRRYSHVFDPIFSLLQGSKYYSSGTIHGNHRLFRFVAFSLFQADKGGTYQPS